jgi:hypothetical protein
VTGTAHLAGIQTFADGSTRVWHTPAIEVAAPGGSSDTTARGLGAGALAAALAAIGLAVWGRR